MFYQCCMPLTPGWLPAGDLLQVPLPPSAGGPLGGAETKTETEMIPMKKRLRVLFVEDSPDDAELVLRELRWGGYEPMAERVETSDAMQLALQQEWDLVIA